MQMYKPDFDPHQTTLEAIRGVYSELYGQGCPVLRSDAHGGFYALSSYSELRRAAGDWQTFSSAGGITLPRQPVRLAPIEYDPPEHTYWRTLMKEVMTVKAVRAVEDAVRRDTNILIDAFASRGDAELVGELASWGVSDRPRGEPASRVRTRYSFLPRRPVGAHGTARGHRRTLAASSRSDRYRRAGRVPLGCGQHHEHRSRPRAVHAGRTRPEGHGRRLIVLIRFGISRRRDHAGVLDVLLSL
jgi:hypothetical protein